MNFAIADGSSVTSFHTGEPATRFANEARYFKGTQLGNFTNVPGGFESWGDETIPYVGKDLTSLFNHTLTDSDRVADYQRPGSGQLFPRGKQWSSSNT